MVVEPPELPLTAEETVLPLPFPAFDVDVEGAEVAKEVLSTFPAVVVVLASEVDATVPEVCETLTYRYEYEHVSQKENIYVAFETKHITYIWAKTNSFCS